MGLQFTAGPNEPRLIKLLSTNAFRPLGIPLLGVPIFLDRTTMRIEELPTLWIAEIALNMGRTRSRNTWSTYGDWLLDWLRHCDANGWDYANMSGGELGAYCRQMLFGTTVDATKFAISTINARLNNTARFYLWLVKKRVIGEYPFSIDENRVRIAYDDLLAHTAAGSARRSLRSETLPAKRRLPKALSIDALRSIRQDLSERDTLVFDFAIATGARLSEILSVTLAQLPDSRLVRGKRKLDLLITDTKGGVPRTLRVPVSLIDRIHRYINSTRAAVVRARRLRGHVSADNAAFISDNGSRVSRKTVHKTFHSVCMRLQIKARFHDLRHTYAIHRLRELEAHKNDDPTRSLIPIKVLQADLGHQRLSSTQIYLEAMEIDAGSVEEHLETLLDLHDET